MKNHDEFRASVFEKAKRYEARRKARNRKIIETVSLSSFALVIALTAYLGLIPSLPENLGQEFETSTAWEESTNFETAGFETTGVETPQQTEHLETTLSEHPVQTTTVMTVQTTTAIEQTTTVKTENSAPEATESSIETTEESMETQERAFQFHLDFRGAAANHDFELGTIETLEIVNYKMWATFCAENKADYPTLAINGKNFEDVDEAYFEENLLIVVEYAGYDLMYISSYEENEGKYILYITMRENSTNTQKQMQIISVSKEAYLDTDFIF